MMEKRLLKIKIKTKAFKNGYIFWI